MAPLISDCVSADTMFFNKSTFASDCSNIPVEKSLDSYFLVTDLHNFSFTPFSSIVITLSSLSSQSIHFRRMAIISLANQMFLGSQPMIGNELKILKKTASRLISKSPTTLHKK